MKRFIALLVAGLASIQFAYAAVNLNTASQAELETVKGIGPAKAKAIIDHRSKNGPFKSVDDLKEIKGFGDKMVNKMRAELSVAASPEKTPPALRK